MLPLYLSLHKNTQGLGVDQALKLFDNLYIVKFENLLPN